MERMVRTRIPHDIWRCIFELIVDGEKASWVVVPLMLVCQEWKAIAQPLLHRYLYFTIDDDEDNSANTCYRSLVVQGIQGTYPGRSTLSMHVNGPGALMIPKILLYTPSLQRFHLCDCPAGVDVLASLVQLFGAQLLHLDITLSEEDVPLSLALIGKFVALQRLQLNLHELEDTLTISDGPTTAFHMPKLRSLELNPCNHEEFARFIARGYFPALIELTFKFVHRPVGHQPTTCEAVRLLFEKFGSGLKRISVSAPELEDIAEILFPFMTNVEEITMRLELFPTLLDIARFIPKSVVRLCLETYWNMTAYDHALVSCLDDLHYNAKQLPLSLVVRMLSSGTHPFLWRTVTGTNPSLAGKLLRYSLWLQEEGIQLQDESGMWVGITMGLTGS